VLNKADWDFARALCLKNDLPIVQASTSLGWYVTVGTSHPEVHAVLGFVGMALLLVELEAQALWADEALVEVPARSDAEVRFLVVGLMDGKHRSAFITYRGQTIRLISVRRSRPEEVAIYESE
jgi:uncharacterized DUF497 family protein